MNKVPVVCVGPKSGYYGVESTTFETLLEQQRSLIAVSASRDDAVAGLGGVPGIDAAVTLLAGGSQNQRPALVGVSYGAQLAMEYAAKFPGKVSSLTLICGWAGATQKMHEFSELWKLWRAQDEGGGWAQRAMAIRSAHLVLGSAFEWNGDFRAERAELASAEITGLVSEIEHGSPLKWAEQIVDPVLVVAAKHDGLLEQRQGMLLFGAIQNARLAEVECGHLATIERPAQISALVNSYIAHPYSHSAGARVSGFCP